MSMSMEPGREPPVLVTTDGTDSGEVIGISLGWDATAEHECGIRPLRDQFGAVSAGHLGMTRHRSVVVPQMYWHDQPDEVLWIAPTPRFVDPDVYRRGPLRFRSLLAKVPYQHSLAGAWSDGSFGLRAKDPTACAAVRRLYDAALSCRLFLALSPEGLGTGFVLLDCEGIPEHVQAQWVAEDRQRDVDRREWDAAWEAAGVGAAMRAAGLGAFSVGRSLSRRDGVLYGWLNPENQRRYRAGWYTIEQLLAWTRGEGPVVAPASKAPTKRRRR